VASSLGPSSPSGTGDGGDLLRQLAEENGGVFVQR